MTRLYQHMWLSAGLVALFFVMVVVIVGYSLTLPFDVAVLRAIRSINSPQLDGIVVALTQLGGSIVIAAATLLCIGRLAAMRRYAAAVRVALIVGGSALTTVFFKLLLERARPELWTRLVSETSFSFPSGHATSSMALALVVVMLVWQTRWRHLALVGATVYVIIIALTRLYLGVHYPTDIIGGWLIAAIWASAALWISTHDKQGETK